MVGDYQIWNKLIKHTSSNQVSCKISHINVSRDVLIRTHNFHCKINSQQKLMNNELLGIYHQNICGFGRKANELVTSLYPNFPCILFFFRSSFKTDCNKYISIDNYDLGARFCRQSFNKGGVCIFVYKTVKFSAINLVIL
jgi:hypothetical protein